MVLIEIRLKHKRPDVDAYLTSQVMDLIRRAREAGFDVLLEIVQDEEEG